MPEPASRPVVVVLTGASNLAFGFADAVHHIIARFAGRPVTIIAARGSGRSYGVEAGSPLYQYPGIVKSGIVEGIATVIAESADCDVYALITDIGNDILYGTENSVICRWVDELVAAIGGGTVGITALPLASVRRMPNWQYVPARRIYFPNNRFTLSETIALVEDMQSSLDSRAGANVQILSSEAEWYGLDHFHLRRSVRGRAFCDWLNALIEATEPSERPSLDVSAAWLRWCKPRQYRRFNAPKNGHCDAVLIAPGVRLLLY